MTFTEDKPQAPQVRRIEGSGQNHHGSATFGRRAGENNRRVSQTMVKNESGREWFTRQHQGNNIGRGTEFAATKLDFQLRKDHPDYDLSWLTKQRDLYRETGTFSRLVKDELQDKFWEVHRQKVYIQRDDHALEILDQLIDLRERQRQDRLEKEARNKIKEHERTIADWRRKELAIKETQKIDSETLFALLKLYAEAVTEKMYQESIGKLRENKIKAVLSFFPTVYAYLEEVKESMIDHHQTEYQGKKYWEK